MKTFLAAALILLCIPAYGKDAAPSLIEETRSIARMPFRIQVPVAPGTDEKKIRDCLDKAFKEGAAAYAKNKSIGSAIDREAAILKESGLADAFVNADSVMYCMGMKSDKEMWKAWIPHPTDNKKVFAILRLKDKAIVTVRTKALSASVVADSAAEAERIAIDLIAKGADGLEAAEALGVDALLIMKDGKSLKLGLAGGFKEQYGQAKK